MQLEKMLTPHEAGEILQLHPKTVVKLAGLGKIPGKRLGKCWRFSPSVLAQFLKESDEVDEQMR